MKISRLMPISYCFGVTKAINDTLKIRKEYPNKDVYFFGDLVHNQKVVNFFLELGIKVVQFSEDDAFSKLEQFNSNDLVIFSAHGHDKKYEEVLKKNNVLFFDTTCIKVKKNLNLIENAKEQIIYIGKKEHPETFASLSYSEHIFLYDIKDYGKFDYSKVTDKKPLILNQSTLSINEIEKIFEDIKKHIPDAKFVDEICDASRIRQTKIISLPSDVDLVIVVGDKKSSNTTKLYNLSVAHNKNALTLMVNGSDELQEYDLSKYKNAIIASGTSAPLSLIEEVQKYLEEL